MFLHLAHYGSVRRERESECVLKPERESEIDREQRFFGGQVRRVCIELLSC